MVFGEVVSVDVVPAVGRLPAEIGGEEGGVEQPAEGVVEVGGGGEGAVAAFVAKTWLRERMLLVWVAM